MGEVVIILVLALILLGPQRLPDAAKQLGKGLRDFRKATEDLKQQFESELYAIDEATKDKPSPTLVPPAASKAAVDAATAVPPGGVPPATPSEVPTASAENVPGLDAALVDVKPAAAPAVEGAAKVS